MQLPTTFSDFKIRKLGGELNFRILNSSLPSSIRGFAAKFSCFVNSDIFHSEIGHSLDHNMPPASDAAWFSLISINGHIARDAAWNCEAWGIHIDTAPDQTFLHEQRFLLFPALFN